jgi:two-component system NtrC family sensor kinase
MARVVDSALQLTRYYLEKSGVRVDLHVDRDLALVHGDHRALGQVVLNILKNAAEAFETEGGRVEISVRNKDGGVLIEIGDNGPGIPTEVRERVFEPFVSTKAAGTGTGLGLSISKRVVHEHGGAIAVESVVGEGTKFSVWLPSEEDR